MVYLIPYAGAETKGRPPAKKVIRKVKKSKNVRKVISKITSRDISCAVPDNNSCVIIDARPVEVPPASASLKKILFEVCAKHDLHPNDVVGKGRSANLIKARREYVWRARHETSASFPRIARAINKDHTTIVYHYYYVKATKQSDLSDIKFVKKISRMRRIEDPTKLTERQESIRALILRRFTILEISAELGISPTSVKKDIKVMHGINPLPVGFYP